MDTIRWAYHVIERCLDNGLKDVISGRRGLHDWCDDNYELFRKLDVDVHNGLTKICFVSDEYDEVIKVGLRKSYWGENTPDFCTIEYHNYLLAAEKGLEKYFAPVRYAGCIEGVVFYLQEKEYIDEGTFEDSFAQFYENEYCEEYNSCDTCLEEDEVIVAVLGYTEDTQRLIDFICENNINDLHSGNWGINGLGNRVMIDYSGF